MLDIVAHPLMWVKCVPVASEIARGDRGLVVARRDLVGGEHLHHHAVVTLVGVERLDNPIAPAPDLWGAVPNIGHVPPPVPIAVTPHVHPVPAPALAVL